MRGLVSILTAPHHTLTAALALLAALRVVRVYSRQAFPPARPTLLNAVPATTEEASHSDRSNRNPSTSSADRRRRSTSALVSPRLGAFLSEF